MLVISALSLLAAIISAVRPSYQIAKGQGKHHKFGSKVEKQIQVAKTVKESERRLQISQSNYYLHVIN